MPKYHAPKLYIRPDRTLIWMRWYANGKLHRKSTGTTDHATAQAYLENQMAQVASSDDLDRQLITIQAGFARFERSHLLSAEELRQFLRLQPLIVESLVDHGVTTFGQLGTVGMFQLMGWLAAVELLGQTTVTNINGLPAYKGSFTLTPDLVEQGYGFMVRAFEFICGKAP